MNTLYPLVDVWDNNNDIVIPTRINSVDANNIKVYFSSPVAGNINVARGGHFISGTVPASNITGLGYTASFTSLATWSVVHNLNTDYPVVTVWDSNKKMVTPSDVISTDANTLTIQFSSVQTGRVAVVRAL